jgi:hypothetical protein
MWQKYIEALEPLPAGHGSTGAISKQGARYAWSSVVAHRDSDPHYYSLVSLQRRLTIFQRPAKTPPG